MARGHETAYPVIGLEDALSRIWPYRDRNDRGFEALVEDARLHWGYVPGSPRLEAVLQSLLQFGLIKMGPKWLAEAGDLRSFYVTPSGRNALPIEMNRDEWLCERSRSGAIQRAARRPALYRRLWQQFPGEAPPLCVIRDFLVADCGLSEDQANEAVMPFRETMRFAGTISP